MSVAVSLTIAGDSEGAVKAFDKAAAAADGMSAKVRDSGKAAEESGAGFDRAAEGFDKAEQRAMGFRDTLTGVQDGMKGVGGLLKGDFSAENFLLLGAGIGDLASGFANFLIPAMKNAVTWLKSTRVAQVALTAAQWLWNAALSANPIGLIVIGIAALIAIFILLWNKCDWFRNLWIGAWDAIKTAALKVWEWLKALPDNIKSAFSDLGNIILAPYKWAFNKISDAWNNTVGKLSWTVPSWIPGFGGRTVSAPKLPHFHKGGVVPGAPGQEVMAVLQAGERVIPAGRSGAGQVVQINLTAGDLDALIAQRVQRYVARNGGKVQPALGR